MFKSRNRYEDLQKLVEKNGNLLTGNQTHYLCSCPKCIEDESDFRKKLYIKSDFSVGWCFLCETTYLPRSVSEDELFTYMTPIRDHISEKSIGEYEIAKIDVEFYYQSLDIDDKTRKYLNGPNRSPYIIPEKYGLKRRNNRVIIPFFYWDELIYYQVRYINPSGIKYFNPVISNKPLYFLPGRSMNSTKVVLVEGVFDAIACDNLFNEDYLIIGLLGKTLTNYHKQLLTELHIQHYTIFLDDTSLSYRLLNQLQSMEINSHCTYEIIRTSGMDPEEYLRSISE